MASHIVSFHYVMQDFQARFPAARLDINALYVDDDGIITSAGTAAALDCCLNRTSDLLRALRIDG